MKILHISKYYEPFKGGIEKVILELATGSVAAGHEVVFGMATKGIAQAAMPSCEPHAATYGLNQSIGLVVRNRAHCPLLDNEVYRSHQGFVLVAVERIRRDDSKASLFQFKRLSK